MKKRKIEELANELTIKIIDDKEIELVDVEYVKEGSNMFLRVYIDKPEGVSLDDCQEISRELSKQLDEVDPIEENYFLEVSSPGLDRPLKTDKDLTNSIGKEIEISLYMSINGKKKLNGLLKSFDENHVIVLEEGLDELEIERKSIAKINLAIKF